MMKKLHRCVPIVLCFAATPVALASFQAVPTQSAFQHLVLLLSLMAFGLVLGQFWLSRRLARMPGGISMAGIHRIHRIIGYTTGAFFLLHPFLMVVRRFWVLESNPMHNFRELITAPAMLPAIAAWFFMIVMIILSASGFRRALRPLNWRIAHGLLSSAFVAMATWHVVATGRHSNQMMSLFWIALTVWAVAPLLFSYLPNPARRSTLDTEGTKHEAV